MDRDTFISQLATSLCAIDEWTRQFGPMERDETVALASGTVAGVLRDLTDRLRDNYPFDHPRYAGQMVKPPHPVAVLAYATTMLLNPNNHALDGGPATSVMEREAVASLARMFGYERHLGHLTGGGTVANLEALWVSRSLHPDRRILASDQAHYTHSRLSEVIGASFEAMRTDGRGRMDLNALEDELRRGDVGTVVATAGTTGLGSVDAIHEIIPLARQHGARVHVDAAYGGFFRLLADSPDPLIDPAPFRAIAESDSVVVDPHKHGLQPYGCGSVMFSDPSVGEFYVHDSPYTYFTSDELHLGEISLECSRAGAAAAGLWATLQAFPLEAQRGLGPVLEKSRRAAVEWAARIAESERFRLVVEPQLDILNFYPVPCRGQMAASAISRLTDRIFERTMTNRENPVFLAKLIVRRETLAASDPGIEWDQPVVTVLRSVLMKPEHLAFVPHLHETVEQAWRDEECEGER